jgi:hypothetical protein
MANKPYIGMKADEVLKMKGRSWLDAEGWCGHKMPDGSVEWRYADCVVVLRHDGKMYRVVEVREHD